MNSRKLNQNITEKEFLNNYFYADELKKFAREIGVKNYQNCRKDELEKIILHFIKTGKIPPEKSQNLQKFSRKKLKIPDELSLNSRVKNFKNNRETKEFILGESFKKSPNLKIKSGAIYWLNRWREQKIANEEKITYENLIDEFVKINLSREKLPRIPSTKMNNFIADFLQNEKNATRKIALEKWFELKKMTRRKIIFRGKSLRKIDKISRNLFQHFQKIIFRNNFHAEFFRRDFF